mgnify:CR=1 FL=1
MDFQSVLQEFRRSYKGPKLAFIIMGGGYSALDFRRYPGSSEFYHTELAPYREDLANFINKYGTRRIAADEVESFNAVNAEVTVELVAALANYCDDPNLMYVVVNSALTTNTRWRRGSNRSFIATSTGLSFEFQLSKLDEDSYNVLLNNAPDQLDLIRRGEDERVGQMVLSILLGNPALAPNRNGESLIRLNGTNRTQILPSSFSN